MRRCYIVSYDISDDKRLRKVFKAMKGFGVHIQYSVFRVECSRMEFIRMKMILNEIIHHDDDQILCIDLGPAPGRADQCIESLGKSYIPPERRVKIL